MHTSIQEPQEGQAKIAQRTIQLSDNESGGMIQQGYPIAAKYT